MKKIFIVTGEHSGDTHAAHVVNELKHLMPNATIEAVGGKKLEQAGVKIFHSNSNMGVFGFAPLQALISHINLGKNIIKYLKDEYKPDLVLLIDYGGFNLRLAKELKKHGVNVFYYISPQVWASRKGRLNAIKKNISKMLLILPFEENIHKQAGVNAQYVGHPLVSQLNMDVSREKFIQENNIDPNKKIIGLFPGSRKMEINHLVPIFLNAAQLIFNSSKKVQFCMGVASNIDEALLNKQLDKFKDKMDFDLKIIKNQSQQLLANSDVAILASGTITLEATLFNTPMIVSYKGPAIVYIIYRLIRYLEFVSLPNIIADKKIIEEFIQYKAKPELIAKEALELIHNEAKRNQMKSDLADIREKLGNKVASKEVATIISESLNGK